MSEPYLVPCKRCGRVPTLKKVSDLFYVQCSGAPYVNHKDKLVKCDKWQKHEFLGITEAAAIRNWYWANTKKTLDEEE
jgi:hypothetical protein